MQRQKTEGMGRRVHTGLPAALAAQETLHFTGWQLNQCLILSPFSTPMLASLFRADSEFFYERCGLVICGLISLLPASQRQLFNPRMMMPMHLLNLEFLPGICQGMLKKGKLLHLFFFFMIYLFIWKGRVRKIQRVGWGNKRENLPFAVSLSKWLQQPRLCQAKARN